MFSYVEQRRGSQVLQRLALLTLLMLLMLMPAAAQPIRAPQQVFLLRDVSGSADRLIFVDLLTGDERAVVVDGTRYTPLGDAVLFWDTAARQAMLVSPDGTMRSHPFVQTGAGARRVDWLVSADGGTLAWTTTEGAANALTTSTHIANLFDPAPPRVVFADEPRAGVRAFPVAFDADRTVLYMDYQPDTIGDATPFRQYAGLFALDLASGETRALPGEPGCFCGAAVRGDTFLRLALADGGGFDLRVVNLTTGSTQTIPGLALDGYTQSGDVLISPDGARAVYALARVRDFGTAAQTTEVIFALVDLVARTQRALTAPTETFLRPLAWTEDNGAILLTSPLVDGTWKVSALANGTAAPERIADATYLGIITAAGG